VNSLPKTVTRQRRGCDLYPGPSALESRTLTTRLPAEGYNLKSHGWIFDRKFKPVTLLIAEDTKISVSLLTVR